jgi:hypothetical protein
MTRFWPCLMLLATAHPAWAGDREPPYYGVMKRAGIGKIGYRDRVEKDGTWRIDVAMRGRDAIDMALYRAAERARDAGYRYVFLLGADAWRSPGIETATVYARPSHEPVAPVGCRSRKVTRCYTADVAEVMRILGGPGGTQPGVPIVDHRDEFGREVFLSGYGTGGVASLVPGGQVRSQMMTIIDGKLEITSAAPARAAPIPPMPVTLAAAPPRAPIMAARPVPIRDVPTAQGSAVFTASHRFQRTLEASRPVRGRDPKQGWTISD